MTWYTDTEGLDYSKTIIAESEDGTKEILLPKSNEDYFKVTYEHTRRI